MVAKNDDEEDNTDQGDGDVCAFACPFVALVCVPMLCASRRPQISFLAFACLSCLLVCVAKSEGKPRIHPDGTTVWADHVMAERSEEGSFVRYHKNAT